MKRSYLLLFFLLFVFQIQAQYERGILPYRQYKTKDYNGFQQVFDIKVDKRGVVYVANGLGLLELSGNTWKTYMVDNESNVRSIAIDSLGRIFIGARGEFGVFGADSLLKGKLTYHSLNEGIKNAADADFGNIKYTIVHNGKVYFEYADRIFVWNYDSLIVLRSNLVSINNYFSGFVEISGELYTIAQGVGIFHVSDSLHLVYKKKENENVSSIAVPYDKEYSLLLTNGMGLRLVKGDKEKIVFKKFSSQLDSLLRKINFSAFIQLTENTYAIGCNYGVFIIDKDGRLLRVINKNTGLISNLVTSLEIGGDGRLWIGTEEGITSVTVFSPLEFLNQKPCNYEGRILNVLRFNNKLYIITTSGLYNLDQNVDKYPSMIQSVEQTEELNLSKFTPYIKSYSKQLTSLSDSLKSDLRNPCWDLTVFKNKDKEFLMVATTFFVIGVYPNGKIEKLAKCYAYDVYQSRVDPNRVYIGLDGGLKSVYLDKSGHWIDEGTFPGIHEVIVDVGEDEDGNLLLSSMQKGIVMVEKPVFVDHRVQKTKISYLNKGIEEGSLILMGSIDGKLYFPGSQGVYEFNKIDSSFIRYPAFGPEINNSYSTIFGLSQDKMKNVWTIAIIDSSQISNVFYSKLSAEKKYHSQKVFAVKSELVNDFYHDSNNITWFGGTFGLARADASKFSKQKNSYHTYLTLVLSGRDTIFGGYYFTDKGVSLTQPPVFVNNYDFYKNNSYTFYFSASSPNDMGKLEYSWYMEGYDKEQDWTPWSDKTYKEYTNLYEGDYVFHVRAIDVFGNISREATYRFSINPPWYRTIWAFFSYFLFFAALVWGAVTVSTRSLKRIIKEATEEIRQQKDELEEKNKNIIDSIRYAQRIQEAVLPSESQFHQVFNDSFVLWKPRDIVSGDFYWVMKRGAQIFVTAADCTGHGVPGAFMSIMGISFLNQIAGLTDVQNAADSLNLLRQNVITSLNKEGSEVATKDGMDISLCIINYETMQLDFAGAYNPVYIIRNKELIEIKGDRMPIGVHDRDHVPFTNKTMDLQVGDMIYMFSDGFIDQFGGPKGKKFMSKRFKRLLLEICDLPMQKQKEVLWQRNVEWRGELEQVDDIIILGIRL